MENDLIKIIKTLPNVPDDFPAMPAEAKRLAASSVSEDARARGECVVHPGYQFACPDCQEPLSAEQIRAHQALHRTPEMIEKKMLSLGVLREHLAWRIEDRAFDDHRAKVKAALAAQTPLLIEGSWGSGKTSLLAAITFKQIEWGKRCRYLLAAEMFGEIRESYMPDAPCTESEVIERFTEYDFLAIDDLGKELAEKNQKASPAVCMALHRIISKRNGGGRLTAVTTNLTFEEIGQRYDGAISSRMAGWKSIVMTGKDWRAG